MLTINEQSQVQSWLQAELNGEQFPVDFDIAWGMAGYGQKGHAKRRLTNQSSFLVKDEDYKIDQGAALISQSGKSGVSGRSSDRIVMTCDAFKHFCLMAQTPKGREIRQYFIEAEKALNHAIPTCQVMSQEIETLKAKIADLQGDNDDDIIYNKFRINFAKTPKTEVYTVVCALQDNQFFKLMSYVLPEEIANEPDFEKYCLLKRSALAQLKAFVNLLNEMSIDFIPAFESTAHRYLER